MLGEKRVTWDEIVLSYINDPRDVKTTPLKGNGIWFYVYVEQGNVYIENAKNHPNSSKIKNRRKLDKAKFEKMLTFYYKRKKGEKISQQATATTRNQVYWYGIFADMCI